MNIKEGLQNVVKNTRLKGRWQILQEHPKVICDTAHNQEGLTYVMKQLEEELFHALHIVFGVVKDKDLDTIITILPKNATYYFCKPNISRGKNANALLGYFKERGYVGSIYESVNEAYKQALISANKEDIIYVGGSTFVVAEII